MLESQVLKTQRGLLSAPVPIGIGIRGLGLGLDNFWLDGSRALFLMATLLLKVRVD